MKTSRPKHILDIIPDLERWCTYRDRSSGELRRKVRAMHPDITDTETEELVDSLIEKGFIDDYRFATSFAYGKHTHRQWGRRMIAHKLKQAGVDENTIGNALSQISEESYFNTVRKLIRDKARSISYDGSLSSRNKVYRYLSGKGYEHELIMKAIDTLEPDSPSTRK